ncbi:MAG: GNAT family N-acetyltransferase [Firmicutes bacterium]|nr:GNAT family N-acetyltransferase [Bacillota bacterium]
MPEFTIREMKAGDYQEVFDLWQDGEGIGLSNADSEAKIHRFLERNPSLSFVAVHNGKIVGTILCGHDGRRGYIYHLFVADRHRNKGLGKRLVDKSLERLKAEGIDKCHLFVFTRNELGRNFWLNSGWTLREDLVVMSKATGSIL